MPREFHYGGQAVIEGVMIRGRTGAILAVRRPDHAIETRGLPLPTWASGKVRAVPFVRGILVFAETLIVGMRALTLSASLSTDDGKDEAPISPPAMALPMGGGGGFVPV